MTDGGPHREPGGPPCVGGGAAEAVVADRGRRPGPRDWGGRVWLEQLPGQPTAISHEPSAATVTSDGPGSSGFVPS